MGDDEIKALCEWCNEDYHIYSHAEKDDGEDVIFVSMYDFKDFCDWLRNNVTDLICIHGKIGNDGVWFSIEELTQAKFY